MPRRSKGARLYLRERKGRPSQYVVRHGSREISTGFGPAASEHANEELAKYLTKHFRPDTGQRDLARIFVAEVLDLYQTDIAPGKPSAATIGYHVKALLPFWGEKTLADVKGATCRNYLQVRNSIKCSKHSTNWKNSVKPSTVRRELKTLQAAINHWHRESPLAAVPKVTLPPEGERRERVLERNEVAAMLRAARRLGLDHVARFIIIGVYTGTRHNAILRLKWEASLAGGHIDLARGIIFRRGAAERESSKRRPPVAASKRLLSHLASWRKADSNSGIPFVIHFNGQPILKMKRAWAHVVREAGLGRDVTPHVLRHTCTSHLLWGREAKGARPETPPMSIWDVAGVIGADASTVERTYGHHRRIESQPRKRA